MRDAHLVVAVVVLIVGATDGALRLVGFARNVIALGTFGAIVLSAVFNRASDQPEVGLVGDRPGR